VKCNPEPLLLNTLYDAGVSFDCASEAELVAVRDLARGRATDRILYANPCKSARDLAAAAELGAPVTVVDSVEEVEKLVAQKYEGGALVRIATEDSAARMPFSTKFGAAPTDVARIAAAAATLQMPLRGISFHIGSGGEDAGAYSTALSAAYASLRALRAAGHASAKVIDIGGGFLAEEADFRRKAMAIRGTRMALDAEEKGGLQWIAEPGRYFAAHSMDLFVQVIGKKPGGAGAWKYTIDDSLYGQFSSILFDYQAPIWYRVRPRGDKVRPMTSGVLFGRTCDSVDVIAAAREMEELAVGDWLWFPRMGAYTRATACEFNGFPRPPVMETGDLPDLGLEEKEIDFRLCAPKGVTRMPAVSAKAFWAGLLAGGKN